MYIVQNTINPLWLTEERRGKQFVVFAEEGTEAGVCRLHRQGRDGEVSGMHEGQQADTRHVIGAGDEADVIKIIVPRPGFEAGDVFTRALGCVIDNMVLLGGGQCGFGFREDIRQARGAVAATDENWAGKAALRFAHGGFDTAGAAGEGGEAVEAVRQGGERCGESHDI